jgi:hypothetical protein
VAALVMALAAATLLLVACGATEDYPGQPTSGFDRTATESTSATSSTAAPNAPTGRGGTSGNLDACALVTRDEAAAALGKSGGNMQASSSSQITGASGSTVCQFIAQDGGSVAQLSVIATKTPDASASKLAFTAAKNGFKDAHPEDVSGVGDEAYWLPATKQLHVRSGRTYLILSGDAPIDAMKQLARSAVSRL